MLCHREQGFFWENMNCNNTDNIIGNELLSSLVDQINWCVSQYSIDEDTVQVQDQAFQPNWSSFRTLQHNLYGFLDPPQSEQAVVVAVYLINIFSRVFSDLCTDTPWDKETIINSARKQTHDALLRLLENIEKTIRENHINIDGILWILFRNFENEYNKILIFINEEDLKAINNIALQMV